MKLIIDEWSEAVGIEEPKTAHWLFDHTVRGCAIINNSGRFKDGVMRGYLPSSDVCGMRIMCEYTGLQRGVV